MWCAVLYSAQKLIDSNILYRTRISKCKNQIQRESNWVPSVLLVLRIIFIVLDRFNSTLMFSSVGKVF